MLFYDSPVLVGILLVCRRVQIGISITPKLYGEKHNEILEKGDGVMMTEYREKEQKIRDIEKNIGEIFTRIKSKIKPQKVEEHLARVNELSMDKLEILIDIIPQLMLERAYLRKLNDEIIDRIKKRIDDKGYYLSENYRKLLNKFNKASGRIDRITYLLTGVDPNWEVCPIITSKPCEECTGYYKSFRRMAMIAGKMYDIHMRNAMCGEEDPQARKCHMKYALEKERKNGY